MIESMLTTIDNPFDPFTQFEPWYAWDQRAGYHTTEFLARLTIGSDALSESDMNSAIEKAIDEIVEENVLGVYKKVTRETKDSVA